VRGREQQCDRVVVAGVAVEHAGNRHVTRPAARRGR
jgi:hypothetical protein